MYTKLKCPLRYPFYTPALMLLTAVADLRQWMNYLSHVIKPVISELNIASNSSGLEQLLGPNLD